MKFLQSVLQRRSFVTQVGGQATAFAAAGFGASILQAQSRAAARCEPERHTEDDWLDRVPGKHRLVFDATMPEGFGYALLYTGNYFIANHEGYGLQDSDLAVGIGGPPFSPSLSFHGLMWDKYCPAI